MRLGHTGLGVWHWDTAGLHPGPGRARSRFHSVPLRETPRSISPKSTRHDYEGVSEDLAAWWPKICPGGLLAGHDFDEGAVARAVRHFLLRAAPDATLVVTSDHPASWLFFRPPRPC